jgi:ABC-type uncharacterized transport system fused permease/ATPase subunit
MSPPSSIPRDRILDNLERLELATRQLRRVMGNIQQLMASVERRLDELHKVIESQTEPSTHKQSPPSNQGESHAAR